MIAVRRKLSCRELVELVTDYLDGALSRRDRRRFEAHIAGCGGCTAHLAQIRRTITLLGSITEEQIAKPAMADLLEAFRGWKAARGSSPA